MYIKNILCILLFVLSNSLLAQDTLRIEEDAFASFLYESKLYDFAAEEYERLLFYRPENLKYLKKLIACYKESGKGDYVGKRLRILEQDDKEVVKSYYDLLLLSGNAHEIDLYYPQQKNLFSSDEQKEIEFKSYVGKSEWKNAKILFSGSPSLQKYQPIDQYIRDAHFKSPTLAALMSTIIPGTGRMYAKDTKDGIISLIFIASSGWQSYRRFKENGVSSVSGWIYGGISLGFYLSNIYGSYQSAKYYNHKIDEKIHSFSMPILIDTDK